MNPSRDEKDIFYMLCARAFQRKGEGFPSTEEEITAFKTSCKVTEEEEKKFKKKLTGFIDRAFEEAESKAPKRF